MILFMTKRHIEIFQLEKICEANITKKCIINEMATTGGYSVLHLPPYHCVFNPTEMV